jgi:hypothetical protein
MFAAFSSLFSPGVADKIARIGSMVVSVDTFNKRLACTDVLKRSHVETSLGPKCQLRAA